MRISSLFVRRSSVIEMMLFCYAAGVASLVCLYMPLVSYAAVLILPFAVAGTGYGLWWMARPDTRRSMLLISLALLAIAVSTVAMILFAKTMGDYSLLQLHNSVTQIDTAAYRKTLLILLAIHSIATALCAYALHALLGLTNINLVRVTLLLWFAMPLQFLLMKLYGLFLPLMA